MPTQSKVYTIRLDPSEVVGCLDVVEVTGVGVPNMSIAMAIRAALTVLVHSAREVKSIPEYEPFDYKSRVDRYRQGGSRRIAQVGHTIAVAEQLRGAAGAASVFARRLPAPEAEDTPEQRAATRDHALGMIVDDKLAQTKAKRTDPRVLRLRELLFRSEQDPINMSKTELGEMKKLKRELGVEA